MPLTVVREFVACINRRNVAAIVELMTADHVFVDGLGVRVEGRDAMSAGWRGYFALVPDYRIVVEQEFCADDTVALFGIAAGTFAPDDILRPENAWSVPAAWRAVVRNGQVAVWQVFADNKRMYELVAANAGLSR
jgi:hypothetical protein